uniref:Uncharacterized protein AlNc14C370G11094 n=1 Tax=Albugo laibachii Nc14 TaxID=890382 RepID=F0WY49_9STRA|nr:conserved hypothetical protein [Albugo laibachii Nc14]|eukprot:CCA26399.1 conserved hypothetical protein [Albugo laibachii Nc14]
MESAKEAGHARLRRQSGDYQLPYLPATTRRSSIESAYQYEKGAKLHIDIDGKKNGRQQGRWSANFRRNAELSIRVAAGVLLASVVQSRDTNYDPFANGGEMKKWRFFPSWYYIGGLSYCAVAVIFSAGRNIGATFREVCQALYGVGLALIYNIILFSWYVVPTYNGEASHQKDLVNITKSLTASSYHVNTATFFDLLPWIMVYTVVILILPIDNNTKKFALGNNLFFTLTIINPNNPLDSSKLKAASSWILGILSFHPDHVYSVPDIVCASLLVSNHSFLYGSAITSLRTETLAAGEDINELLNLIIDSYCFKSKTTENMNFLRLKLSHKFDRATERHRRMVALLTDVWWEQSFGLHLFLGCNCSVYKRYVNLIGSLLTDLQSLHRAMHLEQYKDLHVAFLESIQREVYVTQMRSSDLLNEISSNVHHSAKRLDLLCIPMLEKQLDSTLRRYRFTQNRLFHNTTPSQLRGNMPLNLFLYSLHSFCRTMIQFQTNFNETNHSNRVRAAAFASSSFLAFFDSKQYNWGVFLSAFKVSTAILLGTFLAIYVFGYSSITPAAVAYVMGNHVGGSFSVTVNRVGGVVAGSVVPSVFSIFINQICYPAWMNSVLTNMVLFIWVAISMYVKFSGGYSNYAGLVSAFIAAGILLQQYDTCQYGSVSPSRIALASYSSVAQTSVGVFLFILVEFSMCPKSATTLLRHNIQQTLTHLQQAFEELVGHHFDSIEIMGQEQQQRIEKLLQVDLPALLEQQHHLLIEAKTEPQLWRPSFSYRKYEAVLETSRRLLMTNNLLYKLVKWYQHQDVKTVFKDPGNILTTPEWKVSATRFSKSVKDTFDTLQMLFGDDFLYSEPDQTALFLQMKEAFRLADKDCSGEIDADEVAQLLESIFTQSGAVREANLREYVDEFMQIVDVDHSGKVSFEEFMNALEGGLKVQVEIFSQQRPIGPKSRRLSGAGQQNTSCSPRPRRKSRRTRKLRYSGVDTILEDEGMPGESSEPYNQVGSTPVVAAVALLGRTNDISVATTVTATSTEEKVHQEIVLNPMENGLRSPISTSPLQRQHDILNVEEFTLKDVADALKTTFVEQFLVDGRYQNISMEEFLLLSCLVIGAEQIAKDLTSMQEIVISK